MKNKLNYFIITLLISLSAIDAFTQTKNSIFQYSVVSALIEGNFDGDLTIADLKSQGDFGLGTLNHLDGEMIILDGNFYQVTSEGKVNLVTGESLTPFAVITSFKADTVKLLNNSPSYSYLNSELDKMAETANYIYAVKIEGIFSYVKTRSVPAQRKPYKKLAEAVKTQSVFEFNNIEGTMVGFRFPSYTDGVNIPGYHFHFISNDKKSGGHVLDVKTKNVSVEIAKQQNLKIVMPGNDDFKKTDLTKKNTEELKQSESDTYTSNDTEKYSIDNCVNEFTMDRTEKTSAGYQYWFIDKDFLDGRTLKLSVVSPGKSTHEPHSHIEDEFFFILEGQAEFYLDGNTKPIGPNTSLYCPPNSKHGIRNAGANELKYLVIKKYGK